MFCCVNKCAGQQEKISQECAWKVIKHLLNVKCKIIENQSRLLLQLFKSYYQSSYVIVLILIQIQLYRNFTTYKEVGTSHRMSLWDMFSNRTNLASEFAGINSTLFYNSRPIWLRTFKCVHWNEREKNKNIIILKFKGHGGWVVKFFCVFLILKIKEKMPQCN